MSGTIADEMKVLYPEFYTACEAIRAGEPGSLRDAFKLMTESRAGLPDGPQFKQAKYIHRILRELRETDPEAADRVTQRRGMTPYKPREDLTGEFLSGGEGRRFFRGVKELSKTGPTFTLDSIPKEDIEGEKVLNDPLIIHGGSVPTLALFGGVVTSHRVMELRDVEMSRLDMCVDPNSYLPGHAYDLNSRTEVMQTKKGNLYPRAKKRWGRK